MQPRMQDHVNEPFSPPAYEDAAIAQRLIDEVLSEQFVETDADFVRGRSDSRAPAIEELIAIDSIVSNHANPARAGECLPDLERSEIGQPASCSPLDAILEVEHPLALMDPIGLLASGAFYGPHPGG